MMIANFFVFCFHSSICFLFLYHSIVPCVWVSYAQSFVCYSSFSLFSVRLWLLFQMCMDALEYGAMEIGTSIQFRHTIFPLWMLLFFTQQNFSTCSFWWLQNFVHTHTHTHTLARLCVFVFVKEYYLFAHYFEMHPHYFLLVFFYFITMIQKEKLSGMNDTPAVHFRSQKDIQLKNALLSGPVSLMLCDVAR